ncbi:MAG: alpha/beta hydrolase family protein [Candidatus Hodarchaeota archaeon]
MIILNKIKELKWKKLKELKNILLIAGTILICISGAFALKFNVIENSTFESEWDLYTIEHPIYDILPVRIEATLYIPKFEYNWYLWKQEKMPVIIMAHGFTADKQFFKGLALEFARRGFASVSITARGHHGSNGVLGLTWENEIMTAIDYIEMLANQTGRKLFDMDRIGLIGHSMGAYSVTLAAKFDERINATIAIAGPTANMTQGTVLDILVGGEVYGGFRSIPFTMPGLVPYLQYPIGYSWESYSGNAVVVGNVTKDGVLYGCNGTNPKNYLNIIGTIDEAFTVFSAQEVLWEMGLKDPPYNISTYWHVLRNHLYGDFNGSARKLVTIPMMNHIFEPNHPITIYESINWMEKSMKLEHPIHGSIEYWMYQVLFRDSFGEMIRASTTWINLLGVAIIFLPFSIYLGNWLKSKHTEVKIAKEIENKKMWQMFLIYGVAFILISLITVPVVEAFKIVPWTDYLGSNIIHMFLVIQAILFLPVLIALIIYERRKFDESWEDFGIHPRAFLKSAIFGILMAMFAYIIINVIGTPNYFNTLIERPESFLEIFICMLIVITMFEILFRGLIQTKLSRYSNVKLRFVSRFLPAWKEFLLSTLVTGLIQGLGLGIMFSIFLMNASLLGTFPMDMIGICVGICSSLSLLNNWLYRKQRNVLGIIIFNAFILSWVSTLLPAISGSII